MNKYYSTTPEEDGDIYQGTMIKPSIGQVHAYWDEVYKGKKNKKGEREGYGTMEWNLDTKGSWRFEQWGKNEFWDDMKKNMTLTIN